MLALGGVSIAIVSLNSKLLSFFKFAPNLICSPSDIPTVMNFVLNHPLLVWCLLPMLLSIIHC